MTNNELLNYFELQRQIFGTCPNSGRIFRLSDCHVYTKKPEQDWLTKLSNAQKEIDRASKRLAKREEELRNNAQEAGRKEADKAIRKVDKVFRPLKLNPDDAKVIFHPVDYIVFNGMKASNLKNLLFVDKGNRTGAERQLQKSIEKAVEKQNYEWITLRVSEKGIVTEE